MIFRLPWIPIILVLGSIWIISASTGTGSDIMKIIQKLVRSKGKTCPKKLVKLCKREPNFTEILEEAVALAVENCHEQFKYTRWNCTLNKNLFDDVFRETSVATAIFAASLTHTFAKSCVDWRLKRCDKFAKQNVSWTETRWKLTAPSDDLKFGRRIARKILMGPRTRVQKKRANFKDAVAMHNVEVGLKAAGIEEENCECYGYSTSCTVQRCRKSLKDFKHPAKLLRSRYTEAKMIHETDVPDHRRLIWAEKNRFYYVTPSPNFCVETHGRECRDKMNCSILCCARGFRTREIKRPKKCRSCGRQGTRRIKCKTCPGVERKFFCK